MWLWSFADDGRPLRPGDPSRTGGLNLPRPQPNKTAGPGEIKPKPEDEEAPTEDEAADDSIGSEINDALRIMLPWMTSLLLHLGAIMLTLFVVWSVVEQVEEEQPIIPSARLSDKPGGTLTGQQDTDLAQTQSTRKIETEAVSGATEESLNTLNGGGVEGNALELVGLSGGGSASGGKLAPFGTTSGTGTGLGAKFYGTGGNATKIIYIVDASGSLIDTFPFVIKELKRSIGELSDKQSFTVIFFQGGAAIEVPPRGWKQATSETKKRVNDFVSLEAGNVVPHGTTNPIAAIKLAMKYSPQLVFILSDNITGQGKYEVDRDELLKIVNDANKDKKIAINTIQFLYPDPLNTLRDLAKDNGGIPKFITEADLGLVR
jgi:hypothetical protein